MKKLFSVFLLVVFMCHESHTIIPNVNEVIFHAFDVLLRESMRSGNPETGFPILAPFNHPGFAVSWKLGHLIELDGELRNIRIDGLDSYHISDVRLSLLTMRFVFDFTWPQVLFNGWYNLNGRFGGLIPIFGQGNYRIDPRNFRGSGFASIRFIAPNQNINVTNMEMRLGLQTLSLDIQGVLGGGDLSSVINKAVQDLIPSMFLNFEQPISEFLREFLVPRMNPFLNNISLEDLARLMP